MQLKLQKRFKKKINMRMKEILTQMFLRLLNILNKLSKKRYRNNLITDAEQNRTEVNKNKKDRYKLGLLEILEDRRLELLTSCVQSRRSTN